MLGRTRGRAPGGSPGDAPSQLPSSVSKRRTRQRSGRPVSAARRDYCPAVSPATRIKQAPSCTPRPATQSVLPQSKRAELPPGRAQGHVQMRTRRASARQSPGTRAKGAPTASSSRRQNSASDLPGRRDQRATASHLRPTRRQRCTKPRRPKPINRPVCARGEGEGTERQLPMSRTQPWRAREKGIGSSCQWRQCVWHFIFIFRSFSFSSDVVEGEACSKLGQRRSQPATGGWSQAAIGVTAAAATGQGGGR